MEEQVEQKPNLRTLEEIQQDIGKEYVFAGDLQYRIAAYSQELMRINGKIGELQAEMDFTMKHAEAQDGESK